MAGVTDLAFRTIINRYGLFGVKPSTTTTEMVSSRGLYYNDKKTLELLRTNSEDKNLLVQIFGNESKIMAAASEKLLKMGFEHVDINLGCPAKKIIKNGDGGALLQVPNVIEGIIRAVMETEAKVSIKIRLDNIDEVMKIARECGVYRVAIHGRTVDEEYRGSANWGAIREVVKSSQTAGDRGSPLRAGLSWQRNIMQEESAIPPRNDETMIIGNGDIKSLEEAEATGLDDVMVGRGALKLDKAHALEHLDLIYEYKGKHGILEARKVMMWYFSDKKFRSEVVRTSDYMEMRRLIEYQLESDIAD